MHTISLLTIKNAPRLFLDIRCLTIFWNHNKFLGRTGKESGVRLTLYQVYKRLLFHFYIYWIRITGKNADWIMVSYKKAKLVHFCNMTDGVVVIVAITFNISLRATWRRLWNPNHLQFTYIGIESPECCTHLSGNLLQSIHYE